ncbi:MAG: helix-turn-helix domain-containing protein [Gammaproteobacteria bacterium]
METDVLRETLAHYHWNKSKAAKKLGLSRVGLNNKIVRYGIEKVRPLQGQEE